MFTFFQKQNRTSTLIKKGFGFFFVVLFVVSATYVAIPAEPVFADAADYIVKGLEVALTATTNSLFVQISQIMIAISSFILWMSAELLETVIQFTIVNLNDYTKAGGGLLAVWKTFRDLANMFFIFILLYISIQTILGIGGVDIKKMLTRVILVALLINFSLFFTEIAIDASNIVSLGFYKQIVQTTCVGFGTHTPDNPAGNMGTALMCKLGLTSLFDKELLTEGVLGGFRGMGKILTLGVMGSLFILIAAFVFLASCLMFIHRFIVLIFLLILSPVAFASLAFSKDKLFDQWLTTLTSNCIVAPAYMATTWAVLTLMNSLSMGGGSMYDAIMGIGGKPSPTAGATFLQFIAVIGMMIATLIVSKQFGGHGAGKALEMLGGAKKTAQGWMGRNTLGRFGAFADKELEKRGFDGRIARGVREYSTGYLANSKFGDKVSRIEEAKKIKEQAVDIANKKEERGNKAILAEGVNPTGTAAEIAAKIEAAESVARSLSNKELDSYGYKTIAPHIKNLSASQFEHFAEKSDKVTDQDKAKAKQERFAELKAALDPVVTPTNRAATAKPITKKLSGTEIEMLGSTVHKNPDFIDSMSDSQVDDFMKNNKITEPVKAIVREQRIKPLRTAVATLGLVGTATPPTAAEITTATTTLETELNKMKQRVAKLDTVYLTNPIVIAKLTPPMMKNMADELDSATLHTIGEEIRRIGAAHLAHEFITNGHGRGYFV